MIIFFCLNISVYYISEIIIVDRRVCILKNVILKTPYNKDFLISGSEKDKSIIGAIESNNGHYEQNNMELLKKIIKPDSICLDIGANIGVISLCMSFLAPHGRVFAFEPSYHNFTYLMRNIVQNDTFNIIPVNLGLFDKECSVDFSYVEEVAGCSFISDTGVKEGLSEKIKCISLDAWVDVVGIDRINFVKMDVEGSEIKALAGAMETIKKFKPDLLIEFNPTPMKRFFNENPAQLFEILQKIFDRIYLVSDRESKLIVIDNFHQLEHMLKKGKGWEDLFCTANSKIPI